MPTMAYGDGTVTRRASGRYDFRRFVNGRRRTKTFDHEPTRREKLDAIRAWSESSPHRSESVAAYLARWLRDGLPRARPRTVQRYRYIVDHHIVPVLGEVPLADLSPLDVQRWINGLGAVQRHSLMCLRAALSRAVAWNLIDRNPAQHVELPKLERKVPRILSPEQTQTLLSQVKGDPLEALWLLAVYTGMRQGEILGLRWEDVNGSSLTVSTSLWWRPGRHGREPVLTEPKTARSRRTITLHPTVTEALRKEQKRQMDQQDTSRDGLVFHRKGIALEPSWVLRTLQRHLREAKLPEITFHQLRHGTASMLLSSGWPLDAVSELLGHATPYVTLSIYSHTIEKQREKTAERMGELLTVAPQLASAPESSTNQRS